MVIVNFEDDHGVVFEAFFALGAKGPKRDGDEDDYEPQNPKGMGHCKNDIPIHDLSSIRA